MGTDTAIRPLSLCHAKVHPTLSFHKFILFLFALFFNFIPILRSKGLAELISASPFQQDSRLRGKTIFVLSFILPILLCPNSCIEWLRQEIRDEYPRYLRGRQ